MSIADEWNKARPLLGEQVRVMLDFDDQNAVAEGQLLSLCDDGEIVILGDDGMKYYCWPLLKIEERKHNTRSEFENCWCGKEFGHAE